MHQRQRLRKLESDNEKLKNELDLKDTQLSTLRQQYDELTSKMEGYDQLQVQ